MRPVSRLSRAWLCGVLVGLVAAPWVAAADRAVELARIHVEAIGGMTRIRALTAMRMTGRVAARGEEVPIVLLAARPNRIRVESQLPQRVVVQAYDGVNPPWETDSANVTAGPRTLSPTAAERFLADADFDDPLVQARERGANLEFAGEAELRGRKLLRLLTARSLTENVFILLDPDTYLIAFRVQELTRGGRRTEVITRYDDYRPVAGVLVAHEITLFVDGALSQQARMDTIEANPEMATDVFQRPAPPGKK